MRKFQEESRLIIQRNNVMADITENQSKIKSLQREIKKHQKQIDNSQTQLDKINKDIENSKNVYQTAFAFVLKNDYDGDVMKVFNTYNDQTSLVERYTDLKCSEALKVYVLHSIGLIESWEDLVNLHNLAVTNKELYGLVKNEIQINIKQTREIPQHIPLCTLCTVHLYPVPKIYADINWCYESLCGNLDYENPVYYIKTWRKRVKTLLLYWNVPYDQIPPIPDNMPRPIREQLTAEEEDTYSQKFQQNMKNMNDQMQHCADAAKLGLQYVIPLGESPWPPVREDRVPLQSIEDDLEEREEREKPDEENGEE